MPSRVIVLSRISPGNGAGNGAYLDMFLCAWLERGTELVFVGLEESRVPWIDTGGFVARGSAGGTIEFHFLGRVRLGRIHFRLNPIVWARFCVASIYRAVVRLAPSLIAAKARRMRSGRAASSLHKFPLLKPHERAFAARVLRTVRPGDVIVSNYGYLADGFERAPAGVLKVIITHDVLFRRMESMNDNEWARMREIERAQLEKAHLLIAIQDDEARVLRDLCPSRQVITVPMAVDTVRRSVEQALPHSVLFVGSGSQHNVDGINWFLSSVWPEVTRLVPTAQLHVCGGVCDHITSVPGRVILEGRVKQLGPHYARAAMVVVPLVNGSGLKIKLVEALAHGKAVISTSCGLQGVEWLVEEGACLKANRAPEMADAIVRLITDWELALAMGARGMKIAESRFGRDAVLASFFDALDQAAGSVAA